MPLIIISSFYFLGAISATYEVKTGDTLSQIAQKHLYTPVYGKKGSLKKLMLLNPKVRNASLIYSSQVILLADETLTQIKTKTTHEVPSSIKNRNLSRLAVTPILGYSRLDSELPLGVNATAISDLGGGLQAIWTLPLFNDWNFLLDAKYTTYNFEVSENRNLDSRSSGTDHLATGFSYSGLKRWEFITLLGFETTNILRAQDASSLKIENIRASFVSVEPSYKLWYNEKRSLSGFIPFKYSFSGDSPSSSSSGGFAYGAGLMGQQRLSAADLLGRVKYFAENNQLGLVDSQAEYFEVSLGYEFLIGN